MKAIVYYGPGDVRIENRPEPRPSEANIIAKVKCCAICGSDLKLATVGNPRCQPPRIIGHEMVGYITHTGSKVKDFKTGDRITLATTISCGSCYYCSIGRGNICPNSQPISNALDGAFAEYIEIPEFAIARGNVIKVPESVSDEAATLSEPLSCAINGQELAGVKNGDSILIIGGGPLGALHAELAKALGAKDVMIADNSEKRINLLRNLKNVFLINNASEDLNLLIKQRTGGLGVDVVIVAAPVKEVHEKSISYVRKGGCVCFFASIPQSSSIINIDSRIVHYGELRIVGVSDSRPEHVKKAIELLSEGKIDVKSIITHRIPIEDFDKGLKLMKNGDSLKVIVYPKGAIK
ncbi:MAG TPA: alcohol dehydrogenase [Firmicutes bacterium]|jgi:L-iditol 2-dehydrogenase|nr:alcohol dehydrogenase [Bacillota bacterium]